MKINRLLLALFFITIVINAQTQNSVLIIGSKGVNNELKNAEDDLNDFKEYFAKAFRMSSQPFYTIAFSDTKRESENEAFKNIFSNTNSNTINISVLQGGFTLEGKFISKIENNITFEYLLNILMLSKSTSSVMFILSPDNAGFSEFVTNNKLTEVTSLEKDVPLFATFYSKSRDYNDILNYYMKAIKHLQDAVEDKYQGNSLSYNNFISEIKLFLLSKDIETKLFTY